MTWQDGGEWKRGRPNSPTFPQCRPRDQECKRRGSPDIQRLRDREGQPTRGPRTVAPVLTKRKRRSTGGSNGTRLRDGGRLGEC